MVVIKVFQFNFEHVKGERKFNFDINNTNMFFKQNKIIYQLNSVSFNQYVTKTLLLKEVEHPPSCGVTSLSCGVTVQVSHRRTFSVTPEDVSDFFCQLMTLLF